MGERPTFVPPPQPEPENRHAAREELDRLIIDVQQIDGQMRAPGRTDAEGRPLSYREWQDWRRRAMSARRFKEERKRFLKRWLDDHPARFAPSAVSRLSHLAWTETSHLARLMVKRVGHLEAVAYAARLHVGTPTDETLQDLGAILGRLDAHLAQEATDDRIEQESDGQ